MTMDLKSFAENDFDPKTWINRAWSSSNNEDKEVFVANTVSKLQLYMKQLSLSLDETTTQVVTSVPKVLQESAALQSEGVSLQDMLNALEQQVASVEEQTGHSIKSLQRVDNLKSRLESAASALREADKWAQLATSLEEVLEQGVPMQGERLSELTQQVAAMAASLEVLSNAPDYESKQVQLEALFTRLEAALSPAVIDALTQRHAENSRAFVAIFTAMGRESALVRYWRRVEAARLEAAWCRQHEVLHSSALLRELHTALTTHAHSQTEWLTDVLRSTTPLTELVRVYSDLLLSLEPSPTKVVSVSLRACDSTEQALDLLMDVRTDIGEFLTNLQNLLDSDRRKEWVLPAAVKELGRAVCAPLRDALPRYTELQAGALTAQLKLGSEQEDALERARRIQSSVERCDSWLKSAHNAGRRLAGNAIYPYLLPAVEALMAALCSQLSSSLRLLEAEFLALAARGDSAGVLSRLFPCALALASAAGELLAPARALSAAVLHALGEPQPEVTSPLQDIEGLLLDSAGREALERARAEHPLAGAEQDVSRVGRGLRTLTLKIVFEPVAVQLEKIPHLPAWFDNDPISTDLPDFSLSPQEYITLIGQYLMTLPQHLEPFLAERQSGLAEVLVSGGSQETDPAWYLLTEICNQTCEMYAEKVLSVRNMDALGAKRCATDIVYLSSVVEDLGGNVLPALRSLEKTLRASAASHGE